MRDLQDKFLVRAWLVDPTAKIILHTGVHAQVVSLDKPNFLEITAPGGTPTGRIADVSDEGVTPSRGEVRWPPRLSVIVVGVRGSLLVR